MKTAASISSWHRKIDRMFQRLGYKYVGITGSGHVVYKHPDAGPYYFPSSPSDVRGERTMVADLRRRHPDAPMFQRRKRTRPKAKPLTRSEQRQRTEQKLVRRARLAEMRRAATAVRHAELNRRTDKPACTECGRVWLSDLNFIDRACPDCGGVVLAPKVAS